jgi:hypothetical protein
MKRGYCIRLVLAASLALGSTAILAQTMWNSAGWNSAGWNSAGWNHSGWPRNPATGETISGTIEAVESVSSGNGGGQDIRVRLRTDAGVISVDLGPAWSIERQGIKIEKGDRLEVKGARMSSAGGTPALVAAEVKKGGAAPDRRHNAGIPSVWTEWGR